MRIPEFAARAEDIIQSDVQQHITEVVVREKPAAADRPSAPAHQPQAVQPSR